MRKAFTIILVCAFALTLFSAPVLAKKAGEIKNDVYTDIYGFSFKIPEGWSTKISSDKKPDRIRMTQKSYPVPRPFLGGGEDYAQIPILTVLDDTCTATVEVFLANLLDDKYKSDQKKYFMKYLDLISKSHEILIQKDMTFFDAKAIMLEGRQQYSKEVAVQGSDRADVVTDYIGGAMFLTVRDGRILIFHCVYEWQFNSQYLAMFYNTIEKTLKFTSGEEKMEKKDEKKAEKKG